MQQHLKQMLGLALGFALLVACALKVARRELVKGQGVGCAGDRRLGLSQGLASCAGCRAVSAGVKMFITSPSPEKLEAPPESVAELAAWALCTFSFCPSVATV